MEAVPRTLQDYQTENGRFPFREWLEAYSGQKIFGVVLARLARVEKGLLGDCKAVGSGVYELRIDFGPGYRIYFGQDGPIVVLLCGGTKKTQDRDIQAAMEYWEDYSA